MTAIGFVFVILCVLMALIMIAAQFMPPRYEKKAFLFCCASAFVSGLLVVTGCVIWLWEKMP